MMEYEQALAYIHSHKRFSSVPTLDRMGNLMSLLGNPHQAMPFVHIAGTNGKGSTAAMTANILKEAGYRTGLTISPYVVDFRERMQVNGKMISKEALTALVEKVRPFTDQIEDLAEFELVTALAFLWFAQENCQIVVAEVGLGGRYDATNIIDPPLAPVIMKIGLDHTAILGDTLEKIAAEKAAIIKPGCTKAFTIARQRGHVKEVLEQRCQEAGCKLFYPPLEAGRILSMGLEGTDLQYNNYRIHIPLLGPHQVENTLTVISVCEHLRENGFPNLSSGAIEKGIASVQFPARMEIVRRNPLVIIDGAHNPDGAEALTKALQLAKDKPLVGVMGMAADKDSQQALSLLAPCFTELICTTPDTPRALEGAELAQRAKAFCPAVSICPDISEACEQGVQKALQLGGAVIICGSFFLAAPARAYFLSPKQ